MPLDYKEKRREEYRHNAKRLPQEVRDGKHLGKINNFCELHEFDPQEIIDKIFNDSVVAACFATNPNTQNLYQELAANFIKNLSGVNWLSGPVTDLCVFNRGIVLKNTITAQSQIKGIDFHWMYGRKNIYAMHKYTERSGGAQAKQYRELQKFLKDGAKVSDPNCIFISIADGPYYQKPFSRGKKITRIKYLKSIRGERVHACEIDDLENLMKKYYGHSR